MKKVAIIGGSRIPFARSYTNYFKTPNQTLMVTALQALVKKYHLEGKTLGEVSLGAVMKHSSDWNLARECTLSSGLAANTPAYDVQQACGTSLETAILVSNKIRLGQIDCGIAGGTDTNSELPIVYTKHFSHRLLESYKAKSFGDKLKPWLKLRPKDLMPVIPAVIEPRTGLTMGQSCEVMAKNWSVTREEQDELAFRSHQNAVNAYKDGFFNDLVVPFMGLDKDNNVRGETSIEKLAKLKPVFDTSGKGTLTAGNSTPLTDGAACVLLASEDWAKQNQLEVESYFVDGQTAAVDFVKTEGLLMAPTYAVPQLLKRNHLSLADFDYYEIHEAFAAQVLCTLKAWESKTFCQEKLGLKDALGSIDRAKLNVCGGSLALGHPFAATGARIVAGLSKMLKKKGSGRGLISICTAGGMGVTAILER